MPTLIYYFEGIETKLEEPAADEREKQQAKQLTYKWNLWVSVTAPQGQSSLARVFYLFVCFVF